MPVLSELNDLWRGPVLQFHFFNDHRQEDSWVIPRGGGVEHL